VVIVITLSVGVTVGVVSLVIYFCAYKKDLNTQKNTFSEEL